MSARWRVGGKVPHHVYEQGGDEPNRRPWPDGDVPIGMFSSPHDAELAVRAVNALHGAPAPEADAGPWGWADLARVCEDAGLPETDSGWGDDRVAVHPSEQFVFGSPRRFLGALVAGPGWERSVRVPVEASLSLVVAAINDVRAAPVVGGGRG